MDNNLNLNNPKTIHIAYSGGLDSSVLLHLYANAELKSTLNVIHINHKLSPNAKQWQQHCQQQCDALNLPLQIIPVKAKAEQGESPEAVARNVRYAAFETLLQENEILVTAHHQDDQLETFFLQLLRGAGIKGLTGMPVKKKFAGGYLLRPLLNYTREELEAYAKKHAITWIEDESNFDTNFQRNFLRHEVLPKLKQTWPGMHQCIMRSLEHCQEANALLNDLAEMDLKSCSMNAGNFIPDSTSFHPGCAILQTNELLKFSKSRRFNVLRFWIQQQNHKLPSQKKLKEIDRSVLKAKADANPLVTWEGTEIRRYRNRLYIMPPLKFFDNSQIIPWQTPSEALYIKDLDLTLQPESLKPFEIKQKDISIRFRQGGEKVKILGRSGTHGLKKFFQEQGIPPWERESLPLLCIQDELFIL